ncbi:MAG: GNAT family N-acetyltransferase [Candidatus Limnocylindrales bacterium]|nr:GNAT family N-acetyltransferase [Candidatus Limnocylindrales bacterium]
MSVAARAAARVDELTYRPVRTDEIEACAGIWWTAINDYVVRLGQDEIPPEMNPIIRLFTHLQSTDPERFIVATQPAAAGAAGDGDADADAAAERVVAFASAISRERLWYLSMLFVLPELQGAGVGRQLLARVLPGDDGTARATATDSAQPVSNGIYASYGIAPRMPLLNLSGLPDRPEAFGALPSGIVPVAFDTIAAGPPGGPGHRKLVAAVDALDRELLGAGHPMDHRFLRTERRWGWLYHGPDGTPLGYGYAGEAGRLGPVAARDEALVAPILGHLVSVVVPRGAFATWIGGAADRALVAALGAGFRLDRFPVLLCWDRPFADFSRYLPISPGLL